MKAAPEAAAATAAAVAVAAASAAVSVARIGDLSPKWGFSGVKWESFFSSGD